MEYFAFVLAEAVAFALGYFLGKRTRTEEEKVSAEELRAVEKRREQWDALMNYTGRERK